MTSRAYLAALQVRSYRWLLLNTFSLSAAWTAESIATGWLVLQLTDSPFWLGVLVAARGVSQLLFSVVGGTIVDRADTRRLLIRCQLFAVVIWATILLLVQTGNIAIWHVAIAQIAGGMVNAVNGPASNAFTYVIVGPERMLNAKAFSFMAGSLFRIGSALAGGYAIANLGLGACFVLVAGGYVLGVVSLLPINVAATMRTAEPPLQALLAGLRYAVRTPQVKALLTLSLATEALGFSYQWMLPVMARDVLQVGAVGLGYLAAAAGAGQLLAMIGLASVGDVRAKGRLLLGSTGAFGLAIVCFAAAPTFPIALLSVMVVGGAAAMYDSAMGTVIQMVVDPEMRGRVLGLLVATFGSNQVSSFGLGTLATLWGAPLALGMCGVLVLANSLRLIPQLTMFDAVHEASSAPLSSNPRSPG